MQELICLPLDPSNKSLEPSLQIQSKPKACGGYQLLMWYTEYFGESLSSIFLDIKYITGHGHLSKGVLYSLPCELAYLVFLRNEGSIVFNPCKLIKFTFLKKNLSLFELSFSVIYSNTIKSSRNINNFSLCTFTSNPSAFH